MQTKLEELSYGPNRDERPARGWHDFLNRHKSAGKRRKPPEAGLAVPAVPPQGPLPMQGGAEAPLDFGD